MPEPTAPRLTSDADFAGYLQPNQAQAYFDLARRSSILQTLGRKVPLGINGETIPVVTSKATASWVGQGGRKPSSKGTVGVKSMKPQKIAAIAVVSAEVVRANPANYVELFKADIAESMALAFDAAGFHGTNSPFGAGMNLDAMSLATAIELGTTSKANGGVYGDFVAGMSALMKAKTGSVNSPIKLTGFAFDGSVEPTILGAVDNNGSPIFVDLPNQAEGPLTSGRLLRRPVVLTDPGSTIATPIVTGNPNTGGIVGYGGDFSQVVWGSVGGITYDVSTEATVTINGTLTSLWEFNLVAIRAEAEFGLFINDSDANVGLDAGKKQFVRFTDNT